MILGELVGYAERLEREGKALPFMYAPQVIKWLLDIGPDGTLRGEPGRTSDGEGKKRDPGKTFNAPSVVRGVDIKPKLLADKAEFVFGLGEGNQERLARQREAFLKLTQDCAAATGNEAVAAVAKWLEALDVAAFHAQYLAGKEDYTSADQFAFVVDGQLLIDLPEVQSYWASICTPDAEGSFVAQSLISGKVGPTIATEPVKVKGIFGGQMSGMNYISANAVAFESYGLSGSNIAPVTFDEARKYGSALNALLADHNTSLSVGGVTYAFWTSEGEVPPVGPLIKDPEAIAGEVRKRGRLSGINTAPTRPVQADPAEFRDALQSIFRPPGGQVSNAAAFYSLGMTPSGSRIAVRTHLRSTVGATTQRLAQYFAAQDMAPMTAEHESKLYGIYELVGAMYRDPKKEKTEADTDALIRFALSGDPLPHSFLPRLAARNRAEKRVTRPRAALTKMVLLSRAKEFEMNEEQNLTYLDENGPPAYQLGRLLAVLDDIQHAVMKANTTLVDRFYGSMSTTPYAVMGRLIQGSQAHLQKLRKENKFRHDEKQELLQNVLKRVRPEDLPQRPLKTSEQALFGLGYYHQKAFLAAEMRERVKAAENRKAQAAANAAHPDDAHQNDAEGETHD